MGLGVSRLAADRGIDGNDNSNISPLYKFGYTPAVLDLRQRADGTFPRIRSRRRRRQRLQPVPDAQAPAQQREHVAHPEQRARDVQLVANELQQLRFSAVAASTASTRTARS